MTFEERSQWAYAFAALATTLVYFTWLGLQLADRPAAQVEFVKPLLWTIGASMIVHALGTGFVRGSNPADADKRDDRDREVGRRADAISFLVFSIAALPGFVLAIVDADTFWIANSLFAAYALTAVTGVVTRSVLYRRGI